MAIDVNPTPPVAYSGTVPDRATATSSEVYADNIFAYLNYFDNTFVTGLTSFSTSLDTWAGQLNTTETNINAKEASAVAASETATTKAGEASISADAAAQSALEAEAAVATLPEGTINDAQTTLTNTWSAQKIDSEILGEEMALFLIQQYWKSSITFNTFTISTTSLAATSSVFFTSIAQGATVGDSVLIALPAALGPEASNIARLNIYAYVSAVNTITIQLTNPSAIGATINAALINTPINIVVLKQK